MKSKKNQRELNLSKLLLFGLILFIDCSTPPKPTIEYYLNINPNSQAEIEKEGLIVKIKPITLENYTSFPRIYTTTTFEKLDGKGGSMPYIFVNLPAFEFTITNNTDHIIKFSRAAMRLQDNLGEMYEAMMKSDLMDQVDISKEGYSAIGTTLNTLPVKSKIKTLKVIDRNFELLPNLTEKGYLTFNILQQSVQDYIEFLNAREYLKVLLYEIPVETDEAGIVKKTTNFEFIFDIEAKTIQPVT